MNKSMKEIFSLLLCPLSCLFVGHSLVYVPYVFYMYVMFCSKLYLESYFLL